MNEASPIAGLPGQTVVKPDVDSLVETVADHLYVIGAEAIEARGVFDIALSGGSTPKALFKRLVTDPNYRAFQWDKTRVWMVDERVVPADDERLNWNMLKGFLLDHVTLGENAAFQMKCDWPDGDLQYEHAIRETLATRSTAGVPRFDYVLLGMGPDGHTASLFPQTHVLDETQALVKYNTGERVIEPKHRMTMTYPLINAARHIAVLITGVSKTEMLRRVSGGAEDARELPIMGVRPTEDDTDLTWYLNAAAAGD